MTTTNINPQAYEAALRGAAFLDKQQPGWQDHIDPKHLEMLNCESCILGQLHGHYVTGKFKLGLLHQDSERLGFSRPYFHLDGRPLVDPTYTYSDLDAAWQKVLAERQGVVSEGV